MFLNAANYFKLYLMNFFGDSNFLICFEVNFLAFNLKY
jgi:hypothetical protein